MASETTPRINAFHDAGPDANVTAAAAQVLERTAGTVEAANLDPVTVEPRPRRVGGRVR